MLHFFESVNLFCQKLCLSQINIPINRAALGCGKWFWLHSWSQCFWMGAHTTGVSSLFETPQTSDYNNNTAGTNLLLWTLPNSLHCFFLSHSNCFAHFPVLFHQQGRPACDPVVGWEAGLMICCTAFDSLRRRASALQPRVSGKRVALFSPSLGSRRPSGPTVPFSLLTLRHIPVLSFIWNVIPGVWFEWIPHSPKVFRIKIQVVREQGYRCPRCPRSISLYGERVCMAANMATDEGTEDSAAFLLG